MSMVSFELLCSNKVVAAQVGGNSHLLMDAVVLASFEQQAARHPNLWLPFQLCLLQIGRSHPEFQNVYGFASSCHVY